MMCSSNPCVHSVKATIHDRHLELAKWMAKRVRSPRMNDQTMRLWSPLRLLQGALTCSSGSGSRHCRWKPEDALRVAVDNVHLEIVHWIMDQSYADVESRSTWKRCCCSSKPWLSQLAKWLRESTSEMFTGVDLDNAARNGVEWVHENSQEGFSADTMDDMALVKVTLMSSSGFTSAAMKVAQLKR
ncbi:hypothetical protein GQ600_159 [Phytophthora cactorum]|nr:hypothetical protein GQ600_159 [Phytophthora cactorum]